MKLFNRNKDEDFFLLEDTEAERAARESRKASSHSPTALTPDEVLGFGKESSFGRDSSSALAALRKRIAAVAEGEKEEKTEAEPKNEEPKATEEIKTEEALKGKPSLMDRCSPYFIDEEGKEADLNSEPLYKLKSVADILKEESNEAIKRITEKYGLDIESITYESASKEVKAEDEPKSQEKLNLEEKLPPKEKAEEAVKPFVISDIDTPREKIKPDLPIIDGSATVTFTPISSDTAGPKISVTTKTQQIDLTGELSALPEISSEEQSKSVKLEENEFEEYIPKEEATSQKEAARIIRRLSRLRRNRFLSTVFSFFFTLVLSLGKLPFLSSILLEYTTTGMIICSSIEGIIILLNLDMFKAVSGIFRQKSGADCSAVLASVVTATYAVIGTVKGEIVLDMLLCLGVILSFRALAAYQKASYMLSNLKVISGSQPKYGIKLISDPAVTFAMAKDSIEGDTLIAAAQKTDNIADYMKYSTFNTFLGGKLPIINAFSLLLSVITGFASAAYFEGVFHGFYAAAAVLCFAAVPSLFFIDNLPLYSASKKLNRMGAMIAGKTGAEQIEMANAAVLSSTDLFPSGTVTLHQMKVLSQNSLDDTLIRAASLTSYMGSTLAPIFKDIVKSGNITALPDTDTVKYEDRMGISGWVDNRLLFIGNRTLMEAHGIDVPSVEVDRKILRQGFFPVYVATQDKACALLMVQYSVNPKVSRELRRLTGLGVTLLVNNSDPNLTEEMICDYLGLYSDSVKVMSAAGCHMYKNSVTKSKLLSAPAAFKSDNLAVAAILNCATNIKRSNTILTVLYIISAILGAVIFAYASFGGSGSLISDTALLVYTLICTAVSYLIYLTERP